VSLRVDMVCGSYPPDVCGVSDYSRRLVRELAVLGIDARVVTTCGLDASADPEVPADAVCPSWTVRGALRLGRNLRSRGADVVHIQFPSQRFHGQWGIHVLPIYLRARDVRVVTTLHEYCMAPWGGRLKQLLNVAFSSRTILTNEQDMALLGRWTSPEKLALVRIGSNIEPAGSSGEGRAILARSGLDPDRPVLVFFGFARPGKGLETLVEALPYLPPELMAQVVIVSADPEPEYRSRMSVLCAELGVGESVQWTGYLPERDVSSVFMASTAAVLPFEDGATARRGSLLAALVHGVPVVTTAGPGTPEVFRHGSNMLLSPPRDSYDLAANIARVLRDDRLRADISHGAASLGAEFSWRQIAMGNAEVYHSLMARRRG